MYKIKREFELVEIAEEQIAVPVGDEAASFNGVVALSNAAAFLLKELKTPKSEKELIDLLIHEYSIDKYSATEDLHGFLKNLLEMDLIEQVTAE